jgi:hypothetical protein
MSIKGIYIEFDNLEESEQLDLLLNLFYFASDKLPSYQNMIIRVEEHEKKAM